MEVSGIIRVSPNSVGLLITDLVRRKENLASEERPYEQTARSQLSGSQKETSS